MATDRDQLLSVIREFDDVLEDCLLLYLDATTALMKWYDFLVQAQQSTRSTMGLTIEDLDKRGFWYGRGDPNDLNTMILGARTQGEVKLRNQKGGKNHILLGQRFVVDVYCYWEDEYRSKIAMCSDKKRNLIVGDVFGDIRLLRNSIIHHRGIALPEITRCKILKSFQDGDLIYLDEDRIVEVIGLVRRWLEEFAKEETGQILGLLGRTAASGHPRL